MTDGSWTGVEEVAEIGTSSLGNNDRLADCSVRWRSRWHQGFEAL